MSIISYPTFLQNVQEADLRLLSLLASNERIGTTDGVEADSFQAQGVRLYNAELVTRFTRSLERKDGVTWHMFDGRVDPVAMTYVANSAMERVMLSREPLL